MQLLTIKEAEQLTGRKVATWRADIRGGRVTFVRLGRQIRIPLRVIQEMIAKGWHDPVSQNRTRGQR